MTILQLDASIHGESGQSRTLTDEFVAQRRARQPEIGLIRRNLADPEIPHLTGATFRAGLTPRDTRTAEQERAAALADVLIEELFAADTLVIGVPVYNFLIPSPLKAWFDHVARAGTTFRYSENGPVGLVTDTKAHVFIASGGHYRDGDLDFPARYVRHMLGFLGIDDLTLTYAEGLAMGEDTARDAMAGARQEIRTLVA